MELEYLSHAIAPEHLDSNPRLLGRGQPDEAAGPLFEQQPLG